MKKILLFIGLSIFSFSVFAEKVPGVIVNKSNGGLTAIINMYNYVNYTPPELSQTGFGQLDCSGYGFTICRIPNCTSMPVNIGNSVITVTDAAYLNAFQAAINDVIVQYETAQENYSQSASMNGQPKDATIPSVFTKTIALSNSSTKMGKQNKVETYVVRGVVTASNATSSTMKIYIEKVDMFYPISSN
jgi:hypothetical protein